LLDEGWTVDAVDDLTAPCDKEPARRCGSFLEEDMASDKVLARVRGGRYDVVFHLAALPRVSYTVAYPERTFEVNVNSTMRLVEACRLAPRRLRFVFSSSSAVYGPGAVTPTREGEPRRPASPYAVHKATVEDYLGLYARLYGLESVCLRYFNVFGPGSLGDSPYATAIAAWLTAIMRRRPLRSDGDGTQSRDMCHVDNVVDANVLAASYPYALGGRAFNVACGETHTNDQILHALRARYGELSVVQAPTRAGDVHTTHADISLAQTVLGYEPRVGLWQGLQATCEWFERRTDWHGPRPNTTGV
jgi:UDP-glucose 4-epimerase